MPDPLASFFGHRTALVTGASSGLGAAMARRLGAAGARVLLVARRADALDAVAADVRQRGGEAVVLAHDLEPPGASDALADRLAAAAEAVDVLVNNAGFGVRGRLIETPPDAIDGMVAVNVAALTTLTRRLLPGMVERGRGGVLQVASIAGFVPAPHFAVYAATKAYVLSLSEALWAETRGSGVSVTCLCPGPVRTGFGDRAGVGDTFFEGGLSAEAVAEAGLAGLAAGRRRVVPGWRHKVETFATRFAPTPLALRVAGSRMKRAGKGL